MSETGTSTISPGGGEHGAAMPRRCASRPRGRRPVRGAGVKTQRSRRWTAVRRHRRRREAFGPSGLVIANDMDHKRCHLLAPGEAAQLPALPVTNHATMLPTRMPRRRPRRRRQLDKVLRFDRILYDVSCRATAPCARRPTSGGGRTAWLGVHLDAVQHPDARCRCSSPAGGRVSTCSMNPIEDEAVVASVAAAAA